MEDSVHGPKDNCSIDSMLCQTTMEFQSALKSTVKNILSKVTDDKFIEIYKNCYEGFMKRDDIQRPSLSGSSSEARNYRKQFNAIVMQNVSDIIEDTLHTSINSKLQELEKLKKEQTDTSFTWRPPGNALKHMIPFNSVSKMEEKRELQNQIQKEMEEINILKPRLMQRRKRAKELQDILQSSINNLEKSVVISVKNDSNS